MSEILWYYSDLGVSFIRFENSFRVSSSKYKMLQLAFDVSINDFKLKSLVETELEIGQLKN